MNHDNLYLTLPSNSSISYFPDNKSFNISCTMFTVQDHENIIGTYKMDRIKCMFSLILITCLLCVESLTQLK